MSGKAVGYRFMDALAKSVGMDAESVKQALAEINQLQTQVQALAVAVQGTPLGTVTRTNASIYNGKNPVDITAYAQISGNAVSVCWDNPLGKGIDRAEVLIPAEYKFKIFSDYVTYTNFGAKVNVGYSADNVLTVQMPIGDGAFDSILILMEPKNE